MCGAELSSQEGTLIKWGYFTDNQRFVKAPVSGQMKGLTPQGRNCCLFFSSVQDPHLHPPPPPTPPPPLSLFLSGCARTPCRHLVSHYPQNVFVASFPPLSFLHCVYVSLGNLVIYFDLFHLTLSFFLSYLLFFLSFLIYFFVCLFLIFFSFFLSFSLNVFFLSFFRTCFLSVLVPRVNRNISSNI